MPIQITATLGPSSSEEPTWRAMLQAGATGFRLNTSHLTPEALLSWLERLDAFFAARAMPVPVTLDLQGSKWRLGSFAPFEAHAGQVVVLVQAGESSQPGVLPVPHADFFRAAPLSSDEIALNDAKVMLRVRSIEAQRVMAVVERGGPLSASKGITFTRSDYRSEMLSEKDRSILEQTRGRAYLRYAISYVKDAAEMAGYRALAHAQLGSPGYLIAKLERGPAVAQAADIAAHCEEVWLCRGDLGAELGLEEMAAAVHRFSASVHSLPVPAVMAGQVLEHMTNSPTPTRSEVCYLYDTLALGYQGFVLSDEAAIGRYPVEACRAAAMFSKQGGH